MSCHRPAARDAGNNCREDEDESGRSKTAPVVRGRKSLKYGDGERAGTQGLRVTNAFPVFSPSCCYNYKYLVTRDLCRSPVVHAGPTFPDRGL